MTEKNKASKDIEGPGEEAKVPTEEVPKTETGASSVLPSGEEYHDCLNVIYLLRATNSWVTCGTRVLPRAFALS